MIWFPALSMTENKKKTQLSVTVCLAASRQWRQTCAVSGLCHNITPDNLDSVGPRSSWDWWWWWWWCWGGWWDVWLCVCWEICSALDWWGAGSGAACWSRLAPAQLSQTGDLGQPSHRHNTGTHIHPRHWPLSSTNTSIPLSYWPYNLPLYWERLGKALSEECGVSQPGGRQGPTLTQPAQHTDILNILYFRPAVQRQHHHPPPQQQQQQLSINWKAEGCKPKRRSQGGN